MKIAMLAYEFPPFVNGGLGTYCKRVTDYLMEKNEIVVFGYNTGYLPVVEHKTNLMVYRPLVKLIMGRLMNKKEDERNLFDYLLLLLSIFFYNILSFLKLLRLNRHGKFDVVAVHDWMSSVAGILVGWFTKIPIVFHVHNNMVSKEAKRTKKLSFLLVRTCELLLSRNARRIIVPTERMKQILINDGWDGGKIEIIVHGSDRKLLQMSGSRAITEKLERLKCRLNLSPGIVKLLFVGRLVPEKGVRQLIEALPLVIREYPEIKLIVVGKENSKYYREELEKCIAENQLEDYVHIYFDFLDTENVLCHYLLSDICVFPSMYEPFGLVAVEAMELGRPVILGEGYCPGVFRNGDRHTALFVKGSDPVSISGGILQLIKSPPFAAQMAENARKYILPRFSWSSTANNTVIAYQRTIEEVS